MGPLLMEPGYTAEAGQARLPQASALWFALFMSSLRVALVLALALPSAAKANEVSDALRASGAAALANSDLSLARTELTKAVEADPNDAEAWSLLGAVELRAQTFPAAAQALQRATTLQPERTKDLYNLAYALKSAGQLDDASVAYNAFLERKPNDADGWYALATTEEARGEALRAAEAYERYAEVETREAQSRWIATAREKAAALRVSASPEPAPEIAVEDGASSPSSQETRADLASTLRDLQEGRYEAALRRLRNVTPRTGVEHAALASALLGVGRAIDAEASYRAALPLLRGGAAAAARFGLGEALRARGRTKDARDAFAAVVEDPATPEDIKALAAERL